ncbi:lysylphosphatidylglycerol synthase transmembrane domain-containing protein [Croceitalea sp. MTPC9]|uniref:lysylphosphatidylglycerol synthase transmembrane domain-containing protein n=1 Tax=unclassified Croceitalea TaxID=2632280 RepID=UPI002B38A5EA|nr:lysylphosphatidylglycerol synthase transmembrane domain-containing protein [Croceitalea sp. MTPC6]GMN15188.1 lysylphosphatidylglycerol synthase transmembrane domain-containing protein [Croceitalea sp. MTPC9]
MTEKQRKRLITFLKLLISAALIYFIFTKINLAAVLTTLKTSNPFYLIIAFVLVVFSKIMASFRLNLYFHQLGILLTQKSNLKLYLLGMFYNLFLPGGIGGDAYKGYLIQKNYQVGAKKTAAVLILDRLSGMLLLFLLACILAIALNHSSLNSLKWLFIISIPLSIFAFWLINKYFFEYVLAVFWKSFGFSALVQISQLIAVIFILKALSIKMATIAYLLVFLVSSIVSVLPLTIGGIGSRELTFLYGAKWLNLDTDTSISISFVFFLITAFISFAGIYYHFKKPKLEIGPF